MAWWNDAENTLGDKGTGAVLGSAALGPMGTLLGGSAGVSGLGGLADKLGFGAGDTSDTAKANDYLEQATHAYDGIKQPDLGPVNLHGTAYAGDITPGQVAYQGSNAVNEGNTNLAGVSTDPRLRDAQMKALQSLQGIGDSGGMTSADTANLARIQSTNDTDDAARRNAILQNMHERGMGGSGAELLAQLQSSQAATDRGAQQGLDVAGQAQTRALQALQGAGQMGTSLRSQDYGEQANAASAQDAIDRFNAQNQTSTNQYNAGVQNSGQLANAQMGMQAQAQNQGARQGVNNYNSGVSNQQTMTNQVQIPQQQFQNQMGVASGKAGVLNNATNYYGQKDATAAQTQAAKQGSILGMAGQLGAAAIGAAWGGRVPHMPGVPNLPGNSRINDGVNMHLSGDEVVVPKTLAQHGSTSQIGTFVKHAPSALAPDKQKEAMLSALRNIRHRNGG